jgi:pyruvate dehydrogenase E1 component beta subunit
MGMKEVRFRDAIREAMVEEMRKDDQIFLMGEEVGEYNGAYKVTEGMLDEFGKKRVIDTPISELSFAGIGAGAAMNGLRPIVEFMTWNFALLAFDALVNSTAKIYSMSGGQFNLPVVFRGPSGSAGQLGATHSQSFESWMANTPGLKVISVSNPQDAKGLLKSAIYDDDPVMFFESEVMYTDTDEIPEEDYSIPIGQADIKRQGSDVTIVSFNKMMKVAHEAADRLAEENVEAEVIDLRTIRPLDYDTIIESVKKTNRMVVVEESWPLGNVSTELTYMVQKRAFDYLDAPVRRVCGADTPVHYAHTLVDAFLPNADETVRAAKDVLYID